MLGTGRQQASRGSVLVWTPDASYVVAATPVPRLSPFMATPRRWWASIADDTRWLVTVECDHRRGHLHRGYMPDRASAIRLRDLLVDDLLRGDTQGFDAP